MQRLLKMQAKLFTFLQASSRKKDHRCLSQVYSALRINLRVKEIASAYKNQVIDTLIRTEEFQRILNK